MKVALVVLLMDVVIAFLAAIDGVVVVVLWGWFAVPLGLPTIGVAHAVGISALVALVVAAPVPKSAEDDDEWEEIYRLVRISLYRAFLALAVGYGAHLAMG